MKLMQRIALACYKTKFKLWAVVSKKKAAEEAFRLFCTPQSKNKKKLPRIFEGAETLDFIFENISVRGWRFNHPAERKLMILHGFESSVTNFDRYIKPFVEKGYEVLAFDAPAHGKSGGTNINAPMYARMIEEVHQRYGPVKSFLAHSLGGLAVCLALEHMQHTRDFRIALIAPATETTTAVDSFFKTLKLDETIRSEFEKVIIRIGGVIPAWYSISRAIKNIQATVLWIHDENDDTTPISDVIKVKEANFPQVSFVFTQGLGHRRIYRDHKVAKAVIDFL